MIFKTLLTLVRSLFTYVYTLHQNKGEENEGSIINIKCNVLLFAPIKGNESEQDVFILVYYINI